MKKLVCAFSLFFSFFRNNNRNDTGYTQMASKTVKHTLLSLFLFINKILAEDKIISIDSPKDLIWFSSYVNSGYNLYQRTVVLTEDIDMSELTHLFKPIGIDSEKTFSGIFDGQGYSILGLNISAKGNDYVGLFGVSRGMTLRNLILGDSCKAIGVNTVKYYPTFLGNFVGSCISKNSDCILYNLVNFGNLMSSDYKYVGGIAGFVGSFTSSEFRSYVFDCMNIGNSRIHGETPEIIFGGIVGGSVSTGNGVYIQNCANHGYLIQDGSDSRLTVGGIVGSVADGTAIRNCFNMKGAEINNPYSVGNIVGKVDNIHGLKSEVKNCYWLEGTHDNKAVGKNSADYGNCVKESSSFTKDLNLVSPVIVNDELKTKIIDALNSFDKDFFKWMALVFNCSDDDSTPFIVHRSVDYLSPLRKKGYSFMGWYSNLKPETPFDRASDDISSVVMLCARWVPVVKVTFIFASGTETIEKIFIKGNPIKYPIVEENRGYRGLWCTQDDEICNPETSEEDIELYFVQIPRDYTLSFDTNGGKEIESKRLEFSEVIGELPVPEREEYSFLGWFADPKLEYPFYTKRMPSSDICLYAKWEYSPANDKLAALNALDCMNISEFEERVILGSDEKETTKNRKYRNKYPTLGNRRALKGLEEGCMFRGWYLDPEFKSEFNPKTDDISDAPVLYAKWGYYVKVTIITSLNAEKIERNIISDETIVYPRAEVSRGHKAEWCTEGREVCNPVTSDKDIELYLIQTPKEYTLSFNTSGGEEIESKIVAFDDLIEELPVPEKEGCEFLGWFTDPELKYPFYTERMPDRDMVIHAKWKVVVKEENTFASYATFACIALSVVGTWIVFTKRSVIGLKV